jgi:hypothetical protein
MNSHGCHWKNPFQVRLPRFEKVADVKGEKTGQKEKNDDEDVGHRGSEISRPARAS